MLWLFILIIAILLIILFVTSKPDEDHLYGTLTITPLEAKTGTRKLVNIPWGFQKRLFRVGVPPGTGHGKILRLRGLGKIMPDGKRGDLFLKIILE